ncbi:hypothetical protein PPTG_19594 [Phytophthora nicotianae INRA-310]|uniref:Uncharacterized protein n=1 Tax=Phytophthora nicotianae (strain INRA-310) TaxID=761204 RepID=W2Q511_PHYN3|nr:hypothetical protein PPTG_12991 [Phytophthora nicotianae INRA-310]XP_008916342.1 hypothetical protein PPTG_19594 [Phytophthora nicotianae INRA-310]ETM98366.1 hypothetical protein PPTG_19594 [Phytophthora nicotianae INRA-310]ETN07649.1 hypothetical protein PPTG_12991 [Phytophthora nicotianae INRA-310]
MWIVDLKTYLSREPGKLDTDDYAVEEGWLFFYCPHARKFGQERDLAGKHVVQENL